MPAWPCCFFRGAGLKSYEVPGIYFEAGCVLHCFGLKMVLLSFLQESSQEIVTPKLFRPVEHYSVVEFGADGSYCATPCVFVCAILREEAF